MLPTDLIPAFIESSTSDTTFELLLEILQMLMDVRKYAWDEFLDIKVLIMMELKGRSPLESIKEDFLQIPNCRLLYQEQCDWNTEQPEIVIESSTKESASDLQTYMKPFMFLMRSWREQRERSHFVSNNEYKKWEWIRHDMYPAPKELPWSYLSKLSQ